MGVREVPQMREEHREVGSRVSEGCTHQHPLPSLPAGSGPLHCRKIIMSDGLELQVVAGGEKAQGYCGEDRGSP